MVGTRFYYLLYFEGLRSLYLDAHKKRRGKKGGNLKGGKEGRTTWSNIHANHLLLGVGRKR